MIFNYREGYERSLLVNKKIAEKRRSENNKKKTKQFVDFESFVLFYSFLLISFVLAGNKSEPPYVHTQSAKISKEGCTK